MVTVVTDFRAILSTMYVLSIRIGRRESMKHFLSSLVLLAPMFATAGTLSIKCIGAESENCPVTVDVTLFNEKLQTEFLIKSSVGNEVGSLGWCERIEGTGARSVGWEPRACYTTGTFRVVDGSLTMKQLATGSISFTLTQLKAFCAESSGTAKCYMSSEPK